jgi:hypothetical protein
MHSVWNPSLEADDGHEPRPDDVSRATRDEARRRQEAVAFLEAAAAAVDEATRTSLRRRAAELLLPHRRDQNG